MVEKPSGKFSDIQWVINKLKVAGSNSPRTLIFCRSIRDVSRLYQYFMIKLDLWAYEDCRKDLDKRLVDMFHNEVDKDSEKRILSHFTQKDGHIRVVVTTVAFGLGVQIPNIRYVIHWGASKSRTSYWQEVGRAGRDGLPAQAILYPLSKFLHKHLTDQEMIDFVETVRKSSPDMCIRQRLLQHFIIRGMTCDLVEVFKGRKCTCGQSRPPCEVCSCCFQCIATCQSATNKCRDIFTDLN